MSGSRQSLLPTSSPSIGYQDSHHQKSHTDRPPWYLHMKIAVTGCNGDIGPRVILQALAQGHTVVGIDVANLPDVLTRLPEDKAARFAFHEADLRDYEVATELLRGCEGIVHLAAMRTPGDYYVNTHNT